MRITVHNFSWHVISVVVAAAILAAMVSAETTVLREASATPPNTTSALPHHSQGSTELRSEAYVVIAIVAVTLIVLLLDLAPCCAVMFVSALAFRLSDIISTEEFFHGLADAGVVSIALLFVIVQPIPTLPVVRALLNHMLQGRAPLLKLCLVCYAMAWCTSNTVLVALLIPLVKNYCRENNLAPSQYLMSMNDAALLGGTLSVIGTSTNLVYDGLFRRYGLGAMPFFEMGKVAAAPAVLALGYLALAPRFTLPSSAGGLFRKLRDDSPSFAAQFRVLPQSPTILCSAKQLPSLLPLSLRESIMIADIRSELGGGSSINSPTPTRASSSLSSPAPSTGLIACGDRITMVGSVPDLHTAATLLHLTWDRASASKRVRSNTFLSNAAIATDSETPTRQLSSNSNGGDVQMLTPPQLSPRQIQSTTPPAAGHATNSPFHAFNHDIPADHTEYVEAVVGTRCPCVGTFAGEGLMEERYNATLLAVRRNDGQDIATREELDEHRFEAGDTLLLLAPNTFSEVHGHEFFVSSTLVMPDVENPLIVEVPDRFCFGRYVSVEALKTAKKGGHGGGTGNHAITVTAPDASTELEAPLYDEGGEASSGLHTATGSKIGRANRTQTLVKKVIVLPESYRNLSLLVFAGMVAAAVAGVQVAICAAVACVVMVTLRLTTLNDAIKAIDFELLIMVAFSFGIGAAITNCGLADNIGAALASSEVSGFSLYLIIATIATLISNIITAKACAQIMFPITVAISRAQDVDPIPACILLACTTSASLFTPYGHASNVLIFGPGGYRPIDFVKFGLPLNIILVLAMTVMTCAVYDRW
jgi:di/tricarboxylate transporter